MFHEKFMRAVLAVLLASLATVSFAGGRYADPPDGLVEVTQLTEKALDAAKAGNKEAALENAKQARKIARDSFKEKSTMPMQKAGITLKAALESLEAGNVAEAIPPLEECKTAMNAEIEYYKSEGKLK